MQFGPQGEGIGAGLPPRNVVAASCASGTGVGSWPLES